VTAPWIYIEDLKDHVGESVTLKGWLYNRRSSKNVHFLEVRDGTGIVQCVMGKKDVSPELFALADGLPQESSLLLTGTVREDARSKLGVEIGATDLQIVRRAAEYPITKKEHGPAFLLDHRHLWIRSRKQVALLRIRHAVIRAIRDYFDTRGYVCFDPPIFTANACEGTSTLFETEYFGRKAYLSQSGQLYGETGAMALGRIYTFGPTFRAEKSKTRRHLTEFWMMEPEVAFLEHDGDDFGAEHETALTKLHDRPILVHRFPAAIKAFYMKRDPLDAAAALGVDCLAPEGYGEIVGGGEREDDLDALLSRIDEHGLPREAFEWYLDLRRYGSVPHGGFGLGLERTVGWIAGIHHLREAIPYPRTIERLTP